MNGENFSCEKTLESIRDEFVAAVRREMANENYSSFPTSLGYFKIEYDLDPKQIGRILRKFRSSLRETMPEFEVEYKPGWDFDVIIRRSTPCKELKITS